MAIGVKPFHSIHIVLEDLTPEQKLALAVEAAKSLKMSITQIQANGFVANTNNGRLSWNAVVAVKICDEQIQIQSQSVKEQFVDRGKNLNTANDLKFTIQNLQEKLTAADLDSLYNELKSIISEKEEELVVKDNETSQAKFNNYLALFKPTDGYYVTPILVIFNVVYFVIMVLFGANILEPSSDDLLQWGANYKPVTLAGDWWRLITCVFVHIGIIHLLLNMYALMSVGVLLEPILGTKKFTIAYLLSGICASLLSLWWHDNTISAGASGAIFGMYGLFVALLTTNIIDKSERGSLLSSMLLFIGYNLMYGMKGGVDNAAHLGGLLSGAAIGYAFYPSLKPNADPEKEDRLLGAISAVVLIGAVVICLNMKNDIGEYNEKINEFIKLEETALELYQMPENSQPALLADFVKDKGIVSWDKAIRLIEEAQALELPEAYQVRAIELKQYCKLRKTAYEYIYKSLTEDTNKYDSIIEDQNMQIQAIIDKLSAK